MENVSWVHVDVGNALLSPPAHGTENHTPNQNLDNNTLYHQRYRCG